ncbi:MAG: cytochrome c biogenesis protein CcsA [Actinomycetota bacterium]|nr:cytochrome c biogenesis protein CcsA [Actinomycetota bacterium]
MISLLGTAGVIAALAGATLLVVRGISVARGGSGDLVAPGRLLLAGAVAAMATMEIGLLTDDFSLAYIANHHATTTPFPFDVATAWAALEGSIILWGLILAGFTWAVMVRYRRSPDVLGAAALAVMGGVALFFFGLMITVANPFEVCVEALTSGCAASSPWPLAAVDMPLNGPGPNPLLQNHLLMAIHPPMLYLGYVGLTVPFAYAIGALALGIPGPEWLRRSHRSTLVAWSFLTVGITLGGWWAYEVLSWGGYWAWDPVENASLMPWLIATAFLHSGLVQQRRGMLQAWNFVLVISAFSLTILGTFLTRSGTINSVHSFTQSAIGPALLGFLVLVLVGSFALFTMRSHLVASSPRIETFVSREGMFLVNNLLLAVYGFVVLIGTTYPLLVEAFTGTQVGVGEPFFNRLAVPLSFALLLVMGFGPVTPWRAAAPGMLWRRLRWPALFALTVGVVLSAWVTRLGWVVLAVVLGTFVASAIVGLLFEMAATRSGKTRNSIYAEMRNVIGGDQPFWAGQLSHLGVVLVAIGIAFASNLASHATVDLEPGETANFAGYSLTYEAPFRRVEPNRVVEGARLLVSQDDRVVGRLEPRVNLYGADGFAVFTPSVMSKPSGDLYVTLRALDSSQVTLTLDTSPLVWMIWLGGFTTAAGGAWSLTARRRERATTLERQNADA